jgi:hypothetical protein
MNLNLIRHQGKIYQSEWVWADPAGDLGRWNTGRKPKLEIVIVYIETLTGVETTYPKWQRIIPSDELIGLFKRRARTLARRNLVKLGDPRRRKR